MQWNLPIKILCNLVVSIGKGKNVQRSKFAEHYMWETIFNPFVTNVPFLYPMKKP